MSALRVVQVNCAYPPPELESEALLAAWPTLEQVAAAVAAAGAEVTVIQAARRNMDFRRNGVDYRFIAEPSFPRGKWAGLFSRRLARAAADANPDIIHVNGLGFPFCTRSLCSLGVPVLVQDHKNNPAPRLWRLYRYGLAGVKGASFTSADQAEPFFTKKMLPAHARIFAVPEGSSLFKPGDRAAARAATGVYGDPALLWVGRLNSNKNPLTILQAVSRVAMARPEVTLWCAFHEAPLLAEVHARIAEDARLSSRVHLLGQVSQEFIELLCRAADLFVLGSAWEGSGYALLEAMACGLPAVVSDIPPFRKITDGGRLGALAPCGDPAEFAAAILAMADRPLSREAVRAHFDAELSFDAIGRKLTAAYAELARKGVA